MLHSDLSPGLVEMTTTKQATAPEGPPPAEVMLAKRNKELDDVWGDLYQAQADFKALQEAGEAKDAEIADLEGVKMRLAFENLDLEREVSFLRQQLREQRQSAKTATTTIRRAYAAMKAKYQQLLSETTKTAKKNDDDDDDDEDLGAPAVPTSSSRKRPLPVGLLECEEKTKKLASKSNRPKSPTRRPRPTSSKGCYVG